MKSTFLILSLAATCVFSADGWQPAKGPLMTPWAKDVNPDNVLPEYPRPQFVRKDWLNLNGLWDYSITAKDESKPAWQGKILVPFPVESALSGVMQMVGENNRLWYHRSIQIPSEWRRRRILLHFGAVDWETTVSVNGKQVGTHRGGYDPFTFDITDALNDKVHQDLVVSVWDPSDGGPQPRGKQVRKPGGIFYTPISGIWQTVWLEPVPESSIQELKITPDLDNSAVTIGAKTFTPAGKTTLRVQILDGEAIIEAAELIIEGNTPSEHNPKVVLRVPNAKPWAPESPKLYGLRVTLLDDNFTFDSVESYFGMRKISIGKDDSGKMRILFNNKFVFQGGPLDQGFWPDGLYTAPTDAALKYDIEITKKLGYNMTRKHVKVEPARWYYWCDKLGLIVWQDMPSGDKSIGTKPRGEVTRTPESAKIYETELKAMIDNLYNVPSIIMWVVFNEGWGQYDTERITNWTKKYDPSRLASCASGWNDFPVGDIIDMHNYPQPNSPKPTDTRAAVLGEYGGLSLGVDGHTWTQKFWGYQGTSSSAGLTNKYVAFMRDIYRLKDDPGMSAFVYTQLTDVETECNGLLTYDRAIVKVDLAKVAAANTGTFPPAPKIAIVVPTSQKDAANWRYTTEKPSADWFKAGFDASAWKEAPAGFGTRGTPKTTVRTEWRTPDIWIRREINLPDPLPKVPALMMHHDEDVEVYINGVLACKVTGYSTEYEVNELTPEGINALKPGANVFAVHCHQTGGGQYIDLGVVELK